MCYLDQSLHGNVINMRNETRSTCLSCIIPAEGKLLGKVESESGTSIPERSSTQAVGQALKLPRRWAQGPFLAHCPSCIKVVSKVSPEPPLSLSFTLGFCFPAKLHTPSNWFIKPHQVSLWLKGDGHPQGGFGAPWRASASSCGEICYQVVDCSVLEHKNRISKVNNPAKGRLIIT